MTDQVVFSRRPAVELTPLVLPFHPAPPAGTWGAELLRAAQGAGAELLVMDAYAHGPWREMLFGGVTRSVLEGAAIPVLMRH